MDKGLAMSPEDESYAPSAWLLDGRGGARQLGREALERWRPGDGPLWIELNENSEPDRAWLGSAEGVGPDNRDLFLRESAWPRVRVPGPEQLILLMRVLDPDFDASSGAYAMLHFWVEPQRVITMAPPGLPHLQELKARLDAGKGPLNTDMLLLSVTEFMASRLADAVLRLRPDVLNLELALEQEQADAEQVHDLRRRAIELQLFSDPQRALLLRLRSLDLAWLTKDHADDWRGVADYYRQGSRDLDAIVERARILEDALAHRTSEQMNRRVYILTIVSTIVLPLTLIASLLGGNISTVGGNILGMRHPLWFIGLCVALVLLGGGISRLFRRRWLI